MLPMFEPGPSTCTPPARNLGTRAVRRPHRAFLGWRFGPCLAAGVLLLAVLPSGRGATVALGLHAGADNNLEQYEAFGEWLGRKVTHRVVFLGKATWSDIANPWFLGATRAWVESDPKRVEVITMPLLPETDAGNFAAVISGAHDADFHSVANKLRNRDLAHRVIIRLGWEGNGDWYPWAYAADPAGYRLAFRRVVQVMREAAPGLRFEWCVSMGATRRGGPAEWTEGYPGDAWVDIISMDVYDQWMTWDMMLNGPAGLRALREFAILRGKPEAYPEWSCSTNQNAKGGGDNVAFIENMARWFAGRPGGVLYHGYWNTNADGPRGAIYGAPTVYVPNAAKAYRRLFTLPEAPGILSAN